MMFLVKQVVGALATPLAFAFVLAVVAALFRIRNRRRTSIGLASVAASVVYLGALQPVGDALLAPLESRHPPLRDDRAPPNPAAIVVLGSGYTPRDGIPVTGAIDVDGLARIAEGVRLARRFPAARLVLSGGAPPGITPSAHGYAKFARELGISEASIVVLDQSLDTDDESRAVATLLGATPFLLVTSAYHMPRAMRLMQDADAQPIAAPTGHRAGSSRANLLRMLLPNSSGLRKSDRALHEYVGLAALSLRSESPEVPARERRSAP